MIRFDVVTVGECMVELFSDQPVPLGEAQSFVRAFGGDAANVAAATAAMGSRTALATVIGDDDFAGPMVSWLEDHGVSTSLAVHRGGSTGLYLISIDGHGERSFAYHRAESAASTLGPADVRWDVPPRAVVVTGITQAISKSARAAVGEAVRRTRDSGGLVVYDVNLRLPLWSDDVARAREAFEEIAPSAHVIRCSAPEETGAILGTEDPRVAAHLLIDRGVPTALVSCGERGAVLAAGGAVIDVPAPSVSCVDTTGAGDVLTGVFVHWLLQGGSAARAATLAVTAAALAVTRRGAAVSVPTPEEVASEGAGPHSGAPKEGASMWIKTVPVDQATSRLKEAYDWQSQRLGQPTEFTQLGSLAPEIVHARLTMYRASERCPSQLTPRERAVIGFVTSVANETPHCASQIRLKLREVGMSDGDTRAVAEGDYSSLSGGEAAVATYARKLTLTPGAVAEQDIEELRRTGFGDLEILDINNMCAHLNYINRVANGLGLKHEVDPDFHAYAAIPE